MTLQQMEYIIAIDKYRRFVQAADACGVTQPTLSAMLQKLEDELGVPIFERTKHSIVPTTIGRKIIQQAQTVLNEAANIKNIILDEESSLSGSLKLGIIPTIAPYLVPKFISVIRKDYPTLDFTITEFQTHVLLQKIKDGVLDFGIAATPLNEPGLIEIPVYYEPFMAYFSADAPNRDQPLTARTMPTEHLWVLQEGHCVRTQVFNFCGQQHSHIYEAGSIATLVKIVDINGGYTVIPQMHLDSLTPAQLENVRPIDNPPANREVSIIMREDYLRERMVNAVADTLKKIVPVEMQDERLKKFSIKL